jgi:hypothetical protein
MALLLEVVVFYETTAASQDETSLRLQVRPLLPPPHGRTEVEAAVSK